MDTGKGFTEYGELMPDEGAFRMLCALSGSIVYADPGLCLLANHELVGRNIEGVFGLNVKNSIFASAADKQAWRSTIPLFGSRFEIVSVLEGDYILIELKPYENKNSSIALPEQDFDYISSSVKNMLYTIIGATRDPEFGDNSKIKAIRQEAFRAYRLINNVFDRIVLDNGKHEGNLKKYDFDKIILSFVKKVREYKKGYKVDFESDGKSHICMFDKNQIDRVLTSLFIYLYNMFGQEKSRIAFRVSSEKENVILRISAEIMESRAEIEGAIESRVLSLTTEEVNVFGADDLILAKKLIDDNYGSIVAITEDVKTIFTVSFGEVKERGNDWGTFKDSGLDASESAIDYMLLFELGETLNGDSV